MIAGLAEGSNRFHGLRPFNPLLDLGPTSELIELSFGRDLDPSSRAMLREMRSFGWLLGPLFWLFNTLRTPWADTFSGYVWVDEGSIVGNVTVHRRYKGSSGWFISNLAVHPDHRGRGIARRLVEAGIEMARRKSAKRISLEVRAQNAAARRLYEGFGFTQVDSVSRMRLAPLHTAKPVPAEMYEIETLKPSEGGQLLQLAHEALSPEAREIRPLKRRGYEPSVLQRLVADAGDLLNARTTHRLAARFRGQLAGALTLRTGGFLVPYSLSLMVHPAHRSRVEEALLTHALAALEPHPSRTILAKIQPSYDFARGLFNRYGFAEEETLDLLTLSLLHK
jgi:ribosomal protein S18 acetylase RimI-like enzyme